MSDKKPIRVGVSGAAGRMGRAIADCIADEPNLILASALESTACPKKGNYANKEGILRISTDFDPEHVDVFVDFSTPLASIKLISKCSRASIPMVIGVTGFSEDKKSFIARAAKDIPIVVAPNMSIGVHLMSGLVGQAADTMIDSDAEIFEAHHRHKKDAPSGTALHLGEIIAKARGHKFTDVAVFDRHGKNCARKNGEIGFSVMRGGDIVGEHRVVFSGNEEQLEIVHRATGRKHFAMGALTACGFVVEAAPGLYDMNDVVSTVFK